MVSIMLVSWVILEVRDDMDDDNTASSSRRSPKLRERSRGIVSTVCVYSLSTERECVVCAGGISAGSGCLGGGMVVKADIVDVDARR